MKDKKINLHEIIGKIISYHTFIEYMLANWLAKLISKDYIVGKSVTCEMSCKNLTQAFQSVIIYKASSNTTYEKHLKDVMKLVSNIQKAEEERNKVAHSLNFELFDTKIKYKETSKLKKGFVPRFEVLEDDDFIKTLKLQGVIVNEIERLQEILN